MSIQHVPLVPGRRLITHSDPEWRNLYFPSLEVTDIRAQVRPHINSMRRIMESRGGVALAAPQVGVHFRFFIFGGQNADTTFVSAVINPKITFASLEKVKRNESSLSLPGQKQEIERPAWIEVDYLDAAGNARSERVDGLKARLFQHQIEILDGKIMES